MHLDSKDSLREEFNRWAEAGRGEGMEQEHLPIMLPVLEKMRLTPTDSVLDVGCGAGWILINYYRDNSHCHQWGSLLTVQTHLLSADEWSGLFRDAGFKNVAHERIVDRSPSPEVYTGRWFRDAEQLRAFKAEGALLIYAAKK